MNISSAHYYVPSLLFTDNQKSAGSLFAYDLGTANWDSGLADQIPRDENSYPLELPYPVDSVDQGMRYLLNNYYDGVYEFTYDGEGTVIFNSVPGYEYSGGKHLITFDGTGGNVWLTITASTLGNHIKNIKIIPVAYGTGEYPTFNAQYVQGIDQYSHIRFMDWMKTNDSVSKYWADRTTTTKFTQSVGTGIAIEYVMEMSNLLQKDCWICVGHQTDDDYTTQLALKVKELLDSNLNVYIEFSNELWNWGFDQAGYILGNAVGHPNSYVPVDLLAIAAAGEGHPEKDAYMAARLFRLWEAAWGTADMGRVNRTVGIQSAWEDNSRRIDNYLWDVDGNGYDYMAGTSYFSFARSDHDYWMTLDPLDVTPEMIIAAATQETNVSNEYHTDIATLRGTEYIFYEAGQHCQPQDQGDWPYNQAVWDAQIHPDMYTKYMAIYQTDVNDGIKRTTAFNYVGIRESQYGSWGHLESLSQLDLTPAEMKLAAPKYQATLDAIGLLPS